MRLLVLLIVAVLLTGCVKTKVEYIRDTEYVYQDVPDRLLKIHDEPVAPTREEFAQLEPGTQRESVLAALTASYVSLVRKYRQQILEIIALQEGEEELSGQSEDEVVE